LLDGGSGEEALKFKIKILKMLKMMVLENMFEKVNMSQMLNVLGNELVIMV